MPFPSPLVRTVRMGLRNVWNKYVSNDVTVWDRMYDSEYRVKLDSLAQRPRHHAIAGIVADVCAVPPMVLDVGCGNGTMYRMLRSLGARYHGIDLSESAIRQGQLEFAGDPSCSMEVASIESFRGQTRYDVVVLNEVLYYLPLGQIGIQLLRLARRLKNERSLLVISMSDNPKARLIWNLYRSLYHPLVNTTVVDRTSGNRWTIRAYDSRALRGLAAESPLRIIPPERTQEGQREDFHVSQPA